jgi:cytochrome c biogenesis protein
MQEDALENKQGIIESIADKVWKFFSSVKLAVVLLIILAIVSIIGTVVLQNESPERYLREYSRTTIDVFEMIGLFDMYHTWWFVLLLFLLTANLSVCTLERFPHAWKIISAPLKPIEDEVLKALPLKKEITVHGGMDKAEAHAAKILAAHRYRVSESRGAGTVQLITQKGVYSRFGVYITHLSILLIFIGALIGAFFGFKAFVNLPEGTAQRVVYLRNEPLWDKMLSSLGIIESRVQWSPEAGVPFLPLDFAVQCDDFDVDYYVTAAGMPTGMPSEYHSTLSVFDLNGQKVLEKRIRVNDPLTYHGITFYQSSYGTMPDARGKAILRIRKKNEAGPGDTVVIGLGKSVFIPSIDRTIKVSGFAPYGMRNPATGKVGLYRTDNDEYINPAVQLQIFKGNKLLYTTEVLKHDPGAPTLPEDYSITLDHYGGTRYTGLQVSKDPGVWVVYAGFVLLCIGPLIAFFGSHKKLWVRIQDQQGRTVVTVAGSVNKNRLGFEREFNRIVDEIAK